MDKVINIFLILFLITPNGISAQNDDDCLIIGIYQSFDTRDQICCGNDLKQRYKDGLEQKCCNGRSYPISSAICCDNNLIKLPDGESPNEYDCCGPTPYPMTEKTCCGTRLYDGEDVRCCGEDKLNLDETCCRDMMDNEQRHTLLDLHYCCGTSYINESTHWCKEEGDDVTVLKHGYDMCGGTEYDVTEDCCCNSALHEGITKQNKQYGCCGTTLTNLHTEKCIMSPNPHNIPIGTEPCGSGHYYANRQRCCLDKVVNITKNTQKCCGGNLYDTSLESCCLPVQKGYDPKKYKCCGEQIGVGGFASISGKENCCGSIVYNSSTCVCCKTEDEQDEHYTIIKSKNHHKLCCSSPHKKQGKSYFEDWEMCLIGEQQEPRVSRKEKMCGYQKMNETNDLCCNYVLHKSAKSQGCECCNQGKNIFDPKTQVCCNAVVFNKTEANSCLHKILTTPPVTATQETTVADSTSEMPSETRRPTNRPDKSDICTWCNLDEDSVFDYIKERKMKICKRNALKLKHVDWFNEGNGVVLNGKIHKDIYNLGNLRWKLRAQKLHIPCNQCKISTRNVLVITNKRIRGGTKQLGSQDLVLPFSGKIKRLLTNLCPLDIINNIRVDIRYLEDKVDRVRSRMLLNL